MRFDIRDGRLVDFEQTRIAEEVHIPEGVTAIGYSAFSYDIYIKRVVIPEGVTRIDSNAFYKCSALEEVVFPESLSAVGLEAFDGTPWLKRQRGEFVMLNSHLLYRYKGRKKHVEIPEGVREIAEQAFPDNSDIMSVVFPQSLRYIGRFAFENCNALRSVRMNEGLLRIGSYAFDSCINLSEVNFPQSISHIGSSAFRKTQWLNEQLSKGGAVMANSRILLAYSQTMGKAVIPEGTESICEGAFYSATMIEQVVLPESIRYISKNSFSFLVYLEHINIPAGTEHIEYAAFDHSSVRCMEMDIGSDKLLSDIVDVNTLADYSDIYCIRAAKQPVSAFGKLRSAAAIGYAHLQSLGRAVEPSFCEGYEKYLRHQCKRLCSKAYDDELFIRYVCGKGYISLAYVDELIEKAADNLEIKALLLNYKNEHFTLEDELKLMEKQLNVSPDSVTELKKTWSHKLRNNDTLEITSYKGEGGIVEIPQTIGKRKVTVIGKRTFRPYSGRNEKIANGRKAITAVHIPEGIERIDMSAFEYCVNMTEITLPASLREIKYCAFYSCDGLQSVTIPAGCRLSEKAFYFCMGMRTVRISEGVTEVASDAFAGCLQLSELWLPASLEKVELSLINLKCTIHAPKGSAAIRYAMENDYNYEEI